MFDIHSYKSWQRDYRFCNPKVSQRKYDEQKRGFVIKVVVLIIIMCMPVLQTSMLPAQSYTPLVDQVSVQDTTVGRKSNTSLTKPMSLVTLSGRVVERDSIKQTNPLEAIEVQVSVPKRVLSAHIEKTDRRENSGSSEIIDSVILSTLTDVDGQFSISLQPATYHLTYRQMGNILGRDTVRLTKSIDLGDIVIDLQSIKLKEVVVKAQKKLLTYEKGSLNFNVVESPYSEGFNAKEVLQHMPGMDPDPNKLSMIGKDGLIVLINGRRTNLHGEQLKHYLQSIESDKIERVEMQTNPSPEYSASGNPGVINIVLKKNAYLGWDGSVYANYEQHKKASFGGGGRIGYSNRYIIASYNASYNNNISKSMEEINCVYTDTTHINFIQNSIDQSNNNTFFQNLSLTFLLSETIDLGFITSSNWNINEGYEDYTQADLYVDSIKQTLSYRKNNKNRSNYFTISPFYEWRIDKLGKKLAINYNYTYYKNNAKQIYDTDYSLLFNSYSGNTYAHSHNGRVDLRMPFEILSFDMGGYYSWSKKKLNNVSYVSDRYDYKEQMTSLYTQVYRYFDKWHFKMGLRYEFTDLYGLPNDTLFSKKYGSWLPFADIGFQMYDDQHIFLLEYRRQISRPAIDYYNPIKHWSNNNRYTVGNLNLKPVMTEHFEFKYIFSNLYIRCLYDFRKGGISPIVSILDNQKTLSDTDLVYIFENSFTNCLNTHNISCMINYSYRYRFLYFSTLAFFRYGMTKSTDIRIKDKNLKGLFSYFYLYLNFDIGKHVSVYSSYFIVPPSLQETTHTKFYNYLDFGANFKFFDNKFLIKIELNDIFNMMKPHWHLNFKDYTIYGNSNMDFRSIGLTITYLFGNNNTKKKEIDVLNKNERVTDESINQKIIGM